MSPTTTATLGYKSPTISGGCAVSSIPVTGTLKWLRKYHGISRDFTSNSNSKTKLRENRACFSNAGDVMVFSVAMGGYSAGSSSEGNYSNINQVIS